MSINDGSMKWQRKIFSTTSQEEIYSLIIHYPHTGNEYILAVGSMDCRSAEMSLIKVDIENGNLLLTNLIFGHSASKEWSKSIKSYTSNSNEIMEEYAIIIGNTNDNGFGGLGNSYEGIILKYDLLNNKIIWTKLLSQAS